MKSPVAFFLLMLCAACAQAQPDYTIQPLDSIETSVREFILSQQQAQGAVEVAVKKPDSRLRLRQCEEDLQSRWSPGSRTIGRVTVLIACPGPTPWRVHIQAMVSIEGFVWSLNRAVQRGDRLDKSLLTRKKISLGRDHSIQSMGGDPILDMTPWLGYAFTQRVGPGKILTERMLKRANLVNSGDKVLIRHQAMGLSLQTSGVALEGATLQQRLQVRNSSSGKIVEAVVVGQGLVDVIR